MSVSYHPYYFQGNHFSNSISYHERLQWADTDHFNVTLVSLFLQFIPYFGKRFHVGPPIEHSGGGS